MRVLVACERSGIVRRALRSRKIEAWSCDLFPAEDGSEFHFTCDVRRIIDAPRRSDFTHLVAFPDCTYLTVSGLHWNKRGALGPDGRPRAEHTEEAVAFFRYLHDADFEGTVLENPVGCISTRIRLPDQIVQPHEFGDDASKKTCLWLRRVPKLIIDPKMRFPGRKVEWPPGSGKLVERWSNQTDSGQNKLAPSETRAIDRARTYPGLAEALADAVARAA